MIVAWHVEGATANAVMRGIPLSRSRWVAVAVLGLVIASIYFWSATAGIYDGDRPASFFASLWSIAAAVAMALSFAYGAARNVVGTDDEDVGAVAHYRLSSSFLQDAGLMGLLAFAAIWMPSVVAAHIPVGRPERSAGIATVVVSFMLFFAPALVMGLRNNVVNAARFAAWTGSSDRHSGLGGVMAAPLSDALRTLRNFARHTPVRGEPEYPRAFSRALDAHVSLQNLLSLAAAAVSVVGIVGLVNEYHGSVADMIHAEGLGTLGD